MRGRKKASEEGRKQRETRKKELILEIIEPGCQGRFGMDRLFGQIKERYKIDRIPFAAWPNKITVRYLLGLHAEQKDT